MQLKNFQNSYGVSSAPTTYQQGAELNLSGSILETTELTVRHQGTLWVVHTNLNKVVQIFLIIFPKHLTDIRIVFSCGRFILARFCS